MVMPSLPGLSVIQRIPGRSSCWKPPRNCSTSFPRRRAPIANDRTRYLTVWAPFWRIWVISSGLTFVSSLIWQMAGVDVVGEVDHDAFGRHSERGGHEFGVDGVDQVDQAGAAQRAGRD